MNSIRLNLHAGAGKWIMAGMVLFVALLPVLVSAQTIPKYDPFESATSLGSPESAIQSVARKIANIFGTLILAISVIMILYAAFNFLTAAGDEAKVTTARTTLIYALVGIAVALLAYVLPGLVQTLFRIGI